MRQLCSIAIVLAVTAALHAGQPAPAPTPAAPTSAVELLKKSVKRVPWAEAFQEKTPHFTVITNTTKDLAKQMATALEQQYTDFVVRFQIKKEPKKPLPVKVFAERAEFQKYNRETSKKPSEHAVGYFSPSKMEIVLFWSDDPEDVLSTLYHEVTHYFVDMYITQGDKPTWMDEGLAVYFETAEFKKNKLEIGQVPYGRLLDLQDALKKGKNHSLYTLLRLDGYGEDGYNLLAYAEGWSLVYFFANYQNGVHGRRFGFYMDELQKGRKPEVAFKNAFQATPEQIEPIWKKFVLDIPIKGPRGWFEKAQAFYHDRDYAGALAACDEGLKADPKFHRLAHLRGIVLWYLKRPDEAYETLKASTAADPTDPRSFMYLARCYESFRFKDDKRASSKGEESAYLKAIELRPDYAHALGLLAWFYATVDDPAMQKIKDAILIAERAVELDPTADVLDTLAECYYQDGQTPKAVATLERAMKMEDADLDYLKKQLAKIKAGKK